MWVHRPRLTLPALCVALLATACAEPGPDVGTSAPSAGGKADDGEAIACGQWSDPRALGVVEDERAEGLSGLVVSWRDPAIVWCINETRRDARRRLFAFGRTGEELETYPLPDTPDVEWVDLTTDGVFLYLVANTEDGSVIARLPEPDPSDGREVEVFEVFRVDAPSDDPLDALFVDASSETLYAFTRSRTETHLLAAALDFDGDVSFDRVSGSAELPDLAGEIVGADMTPDGQHLAVKIRRDGVALWRRGEQSLVEALEASPCIGPEAPGSDRAVAIEPGGAGYLLAPDVEDHAVLYAVREPTACPDFEPYERTGRLETPSAIELSGIAASRA